MYSMNRYTPSRLCSDWFKWDGAEAASSRLPRLSCVLPRRSAIAGFTADPNEPGQRRNTSLFWTKVSGVTAL